MKAYRIYWLFFKFLIVFNLLISGLLVLPIYTAEKISTGIFALLILGKIVGWAASILIERWFYARDREILFKNAGFSYTYLFAYLFVIDFLYLLTIIAICLTLKSYI